MSCEVGSWIPLFSALLGQPSCVGQMLRVGTFRTQRPTLPERRILAQPKESAS